MNGVLYDENLDSVLREEYAFHDCDIFSAESIYRYPPEIDVSIIIPCYNVERFLPSCIESLAAQKTQYTYEVILVNDGSKDATKDILDAAALRYDVFRCIHQSNQGCGGARNEGLRNARGKYLMFVDADDIVSADYVEALVDCVKAIDADMGVCAYYSFDDASGRKYKKVEWPQNVKIGDVNGTAWGKIYRRELFEQLLWPSGYWYQDTISAFLIFPRVKKIAVTNKCTYGYRSSMQNTTNTSKKSSKALSTLYITSLVLRHMENFGLSDWLYTLEGHDRLVNQFYLNQCRIQRLPENCRKEVFRLQNKYYQAMSSHATGKHRYDSRLYAWALRNNNAAMGELAVKLEKVNKALRIVSARAALVLRHNKAT